MDFITTFIGVPYAWWMEGDSCLGNKGPFWAAPASAPFPTRQQLEQEGVCCAGLINLLCRHLGLEIPGVAEGDEHAGGTYAWEAHLRRAGVLTAAELLDPATLAPGTLLLLPFESELQQGHLAIVVEAGYIVHSWCEDLPPRRGVMGPGVMKQPLQEALSIFPFTHAIPFAKWTASCAIRPLSTS